MAQLMTVDQLISIASSAGIPLADAPINEANLYVLIDPEGHNLYIGKASSKARHMDEERWRLLDYTNEIVSGFTALVVENDARRRALRYDSSSFDASKLKDHITAHQWGGEALDTVVKRLGDEEGAPTVEEVEQILVRVHIRTGRLIGNSQFASQWETPIGTFTDTVAVLAADAGRVSGALSPETTIDTTGLDTDKEDGGRNDA